MESTLAVCQSWPVRRCGVHPHHVPGATPDLPCPAPAISARIDPALSELGVDQLTRNRRRRTLSVRVVRPEPAIRRLNTQARSELRNAGVSEVAWARTWWPDGRWRGDVCGCPDARCIGFHHQADEDCGCLAALLAWTN